LDLLIRRTETGYEIESQVDETKLQEAVIKIENIRMQITKLDHDLAPKRKVLGLSAECEDYWIKQNEGVRKLDPTIPASYRVALSIVDGGNSGKRIADLVDVTQLSHPHVQYHLTRASGASEWYSQDEDKIWTLTDAGLERLRQTILPYLQGRHDNEMSRIVKWIDKRILGNQLEEWILKKKPGKVDKTDVLEYSVGLLLTTLGFLVFQVGMYNDHFDIVAYAEDGARVLLCDCTRGTVRKKASTLGISVEDFKKEFPDLSVEGVVFTTERILKTDRKDLLKDGIRIADISQIKDLYKISMTNRNPELLFDALQKKEP
jgi:hypothetical protein